MQNNQKFNIKTSGKDLETRNDINTRLQGFITPQYTTSHNNTTNSSNFNSNFIKTSENQTYSDRNDFKNEINNRMNSFADYSDINMKRLPFNNNIRDYGITMSSKKDEFNERLSNYNLLSSNMTQNPLLDNKTNNIGFHTSFKDDVNSRMEKLSPLSRNMHLCLY